MVSDDPKPLALGWTGDDAVMADLRNWLVGRGYNVVLDHVDINAFGNQVVMLTRPIAVRLARDRTQWSVEAMGSDGKWVSVGRWRDALRGTGPQLLSAADQAAIVRDLLDEIERRA